MWHENKAQHNEANERAWLVITPSPLVKKWEEGLTMNLDAHETQPMVSLQRVDETNWHHCTQLEVTEEQKKIFPVEVVYWLAESAYCGYTPLALYAGEQLVGFAVYAVDPDDGSYWIMAYMIDRRYQRRGVGYSGMKALIRLDRMLKHKYTSK